MIFARVLIVFLLVVAALIDEACSVGLMLAPPGSAGYTFGDAFLNALSMAAASGTAAAGGAAGVAAAGAGAAGAASAGGAAGAAAAGAGATAAGAGAAAAGSGAVVAAGPPAAIAAGPLIVVGLAIVVGVDESPSAITWDCWKPILHEMSTAPSRGRLLTDILNDPVISDYQIGKHAVIIRNRWNESWRIDPLILPWGQVAAHASQIASTSFNQSANLADASCTSCSMNAIGAFHTTQPQVVIIQ
eukprot:TRINITY_DN4266_c1_g5_i1.p1 TRINITY_DN4266_c1_g5~~TRINITY_DN4266_c1_g5_i1.p1  ORF type:complete len:245 (+),score=27.27 TRINITY_DN4266_c1_g5_i1:738-1472(+)